MPRPHRRLWGVVFAWVAASAFAAPDTLDPVRDALRRGDVDAVDGSLVDRLVDDPPSADVLLECAYLAQEAEASAATSHVRTLANRLLDDGKGPPAARIARGYAALGTAIWYWRNKTQGSAIGGLFDEALASATTRSGDPAADDLAALLAARTRAALGEFDAAIDALAARRKDGAVSTWTPLLALSEARLRYDRAADASRDAEGSAPDPLRDDLETAAALFSEHDAAIDALLVIPSKRDDLAARCAWTPHRLGRVDDAIAAYERLYARGGTSSTYAVRGLVSLLTHEPDRCHATLRAWAIAAGRAGAIAWDALVASFIDAGRLGPALAAAESRRELDLDDPAGWRAVASVFEAMDQPEEAIRHLEEALRRAPDDAASIARFDAIARGAMDDDPDRTIAWYARLVAVSPNDPFLWNNYAFLLRERVAPHTTIDAAGLQRLKPDAPAGARAMLDRCVDAYERAVALIDPAQDGQRDLQADWDLATVVNDLGLMLHYFVDVQDAPRAEALYLRALSMTEDGYKDSYVPNLRRLYEHVLTDRELAWYRAAQRAANGLLMEVARDDGGYDLVPDDAKRAQARADAARLRTRLLDELGVPPVPSPADDVPPENAPAPADDGAPEPSPR